MAHDLDPNIANYLIESQRAEGNKPGAIKDPEELLPYYQFDKRLDGPTGHTEEVLAVYTRPDYEKVITGSVDQTIKVWDKKTFSCLMTLTGHTDVVNAVFGLDPWIFSGSEDRTVKVWSQKEKRCVGSATTSSWVYAIFADKEFIYAGCYDGNVFIYENPKHPPPPQLPPGVNPPPTVVDVKLKCQFKAHESGGVVSLFVDANHIYTASNDTTIRVWDRLNPTQPIKVLNGHVDGVSSVFVHENRIYSGSYDNTIRVWNKESGEPIFVLKGHLSWIFGVIVHHDRIYSGSYDDTVMVWHVETGQRIQTLVNQHNHSRVRAISVDDNRIYAAQSDNATQVWIKVPGEFVHKLEKHTSSVKAVWVDETRIYTAGVDKKVEMWDKFTCKPLGTLIGHERGIKCLFVKGDKVYSGSEDETIRIWDKNTGLCLKTMKNESKKGAGVNCIWVDEGRIYSGSEDAKLRIWDNNVDLLEIKKKFQEEVEAQKLQNVNLDDGNGVVTRSDPLSVWNILNKKELAEKLKKKKKHPTPFQVIQKVVPLKTLPSIEINRRGSLWSKASYSSSDSDSDDDEEEYDPTHYHTKSILSIFVFEDLIYTGSQDETIRIWNKVTYTWIHTINATIDNVTLGAVFCLWVDDEKIYAGGEAQKLYIWDRESREAQDVIAVESHVSDETADKNADTTNNVFCLHVDEGRIYHGSRNTVQIRDKAQPEKILQELEGHSSWVYALTVDEGKVFTGSFDKSVRVWEIEAIDCPAFFQQCMAFGTISEHSRKYIDSTDKSGRTGLMASARAGSKENAFKLLEMECQHGLSYCNKFGESAIFYALRGRHWEFLEFFCKEFKHLKLNSKDTATMKLLKNRAIANDMEFFYRFLKLKIEYDEREILSTAIKHNHLWFIDAWKDVNKAFALHEACFYGRPEIVAKLMDNPRINVNVLDPKYHNVTALQICHMNADYSELNDGGPESLPQEEEDAGVLGKLTAAEPDHSHKSLLIISKKPKSKKGWIPDDVWDSYEFGLITRRLECYELITHTTEVTKRPNYDYIADDGKTVYDRALEQHNFLMEKMKVPKREIGDRDRLVREKELFKQTAGVLDFYHEIPEIGDMRTAYANLKFIKEGALFLAFLIVITAVGILGSTNGNDGAYSMYSAVQGTFFGDDFTGIAAAGDFWSWVDDTLLGNVYNEDDFSGTGFVMNYNYVVGAIRFRQLRLKNDSCTVRDLYSDDIDFCYENIFTPKGEDKSAYGPDGMFQYSHNGANGDRYWSVDNTWYPDTGFIEDFPSNDETTARNLSQSLQENGWIDAGTRMVLVTFTLYNGNLQGTFAVVRAELEFSAAGVVQPWVYITVLGPNTYDTDIGAPGGVKLALELIVILFVFYEFIFTEFSEMRQSIVDSRALAKSLAQYTTNEEKLIKSPTIEGLKNYWSEAWNYFEWSIIVIFWVLVILRIRTMVMISETDLHPPGDKFTNLQSMAFIFAYEQDLFALWLTMNWLRLLKFLRIPTFSGPLTQSIMDTLSSSTVFVFVLIIFYIVLTFALSYHIAFGLDIPDYKDYGTSLMSLFQFLFGNWDYSILFNSNKVFGPILYMIFIVFTSLVLLNLLIGVLGEAYGEAQEANEKRWSRFITRLMIESLEERCKPPNRPKYFFYEYELAELENAEEVRLDIDEQEKEGSNEQLIYYDDDELDEMIGEEEPEDGADDEDAPRAEGSTKKKVKKVGHKIKKLKKKQEEFREEVRQAFADMQKKFDLLAQHLVDSKSTEKDPNAN